MKKALFVCVVVATFLATGCPTGNAGPTVQTEHAWMPSLDAALSKAAQDGRLVLMLAGRDTCGLCTHMKDTICETDSVKAVLLESYITAYVDIDNSTDWYPFAPGGSFYLPLIASIDPANPDTAIHSTTGTHTEEEFLAQIQDALQ
jgi:thioredoxin-related protein